MHIAISDAKAKLTDLVRRAEAGDEVVLTRHGRPAVKIVPVEHEPKIDREDLRARRRAILDDIIAAARANGPYRGPPAERAADFLYGGDGLPV
jgi:prevent-host-death family protein